MKIFLWTFGSGWSLVIQGFVEQKNQMIKILAWSGRGYVQWVPYNTQTVAGRSEGLGNPRRGLGILALVAVAASRAFICPVYLFPLCFPNCERV